MRFIKVLFLVFISVNAFGQIVPKPCKQTLASEFINLSKAKIIFHNSSPDDLGLLRSNCFELLHSFLPKGLEIPLSTIVKRHTGQNITKGKYELVIKKDEINIHGDEVGTYYAIQTLRQLIFQSNGKLQCQTIIDSPKFAWRGMHLDCSRHFFDVDFIKKYIDVLALHKMNTFHWHLTDDQGWRIEIKKYPNLTQIGSQRKETIIEKHFDPYKGDGKPYDGFYTQEEIKEVVAYAKERYITVVPEIEMPGHAVAALAAYPQYSCRQQPMETLTTWGVSDDIFCSKDSTFNFLFDIMEEVLELFPSKYIHIGGDEAPKTRWKECAHCQANIKNYNLKDEYELQSYFIGRMDSFLISKGRKTIGWDEILEGGLAENAAVMSWRGEQGGIAAAKQKHNVVMSPGSHCYFDHYQGDKKTEPLAIGGYTPLKKVYSYNPIPKSLNKKYHEYILGAQGNVWTEYMATTEHVMYMALPRMCALSEVLWSGPEKHSYMDFTSRLIPHFDLLDSLAYNYSKALFNIEANSSIENGNMNIALTSDFPEYNIRYTTNGQEPKAKSSEYKRPITLKYDMQLQARLFKNGKPYGNIFSQQYKHHLAVGKKMEVNMPSEIYNTGGGHTLLNGVVGGLPWSGNEWLGWRGQPMSAGIGFEKLTKISTVKVSFLQAKESWIYLPEKVIVNVQDDNGNFVPIELKKWNDDFTVEGNITALSRLISIEATPLKEIPEGNPGAGSKPWLFCSEIIVE